MAHPRFVQFLLASLAAWVLAVTFPTAQTEPLPDPDVVFNARSNLYHRESCISARQCTDDCTVIRVSEAKKRGAHACKLCGGQKTT